MNNNNDYTVLLLHESNIRTTLDAIGYHDSPATEEALRQCFLDLVTSGAWGDTIDYNSVAELNEYSIETICMNIHHLTT